MAGAEPLPPLRVRKDSGSPNVIPVFDIIVSGATLTRQGAGVVQLLIDSGGATGAPVGAAYVTYQTDPTLSAELVLTSGTGLVVSSNATNFFVSLSTPVVVTSGGTGVSTLTAFGVLYGSGASAIQALAAMATGSLIVGSGTSARPYILTVGSAGQVLSISGGTVSGLAWLTTGAGGGSGTVNAGSAGNLAYYPSAGTTVDDLVIGSATTLVGVNSSAGLHEYKVNIAGSSTTVTFAGTAWQVSATTSSFVSPLAVNSGGTGQTTNTAFGLLYGSGATAIQALPTINSGQIVVGSGVNFRPHTLAAASAGFYLVTSYGGPVGGLAWVATDSILAGSAGNLAYYPAAGQQVDDLVIGSANTLVAVNSSGAIHEYKVNITGSSTTVTFTGTAWQVSATTSSFVRPLVVDSGGTGVSTLTAFGVLYGSGASAVQALPAMNSGEIVVGSGVNMRPHIMTTGAAGTYLVTSAGTVGGLAWVNTSNVIYAPTGGNYVIFASDTSLVNANILTAGSYLTITSAAGRVTVSTSAKTIRFPMALMTVAPDSANAFWTAKSGTTVDQAYVAFVDSGLGWATYWAQIPLNLSPVPAWSVLVYNTPNSGNGGVCIFSLSGVVIAAAGSIDTTYTSLVSVGTIFANTSNILGIDTTTATNFDSSLAITSGNLLFIELTRHANLAGDAVNAQWNVFNISLQCNVV